MLEFFTNLESCLIGLEASAGAHYWVRELMKLGHEVRLMSLQFVKPYVKGNTSLSCSATSYLGYFQQ